MSEIRKFSFERLLKLKRTPKLQGEYMAQLIDDVERLYMGDEVVTGEKVPFLMSLQGESEKDAALTVMAYLTPHRQLSLQERLEVIGVSLGELTPNDAIPNGVKNFYRSANPMILMTREAPEDYHRPIEIAQAIGRLLYGTQNVESVTKFVQAFDMAALEDGRDGEAPMLDAPR